jgi:excisionase family DNA binding protein
LRSIVSPRELAEAIGVSESSVKRWVDQGDIEAMRTAGGHRRISIQEAGRYVRERSIPLVRPDVLGLSDLAAYDDGESEAGDIVARFFDYLRRGAEPEARGLILSQYLEGRSVAEIVDGPLRAAMTRIGELWIHEPPGIFWEHRATQIAMQALARLRLLLKVPDDAPVAVGGAPAGDPYLLPSLAVAAVLEGEGLRAVNLGAETPAETLALGAEDHKARLVWLSVSFVEAPDRIREGTLGLLAALAEGGTPLVVGGTQAKKLRLPKSDLLYVGGSMAELEALVKGMKLAVPPQAEGRIDSRRGMSRSVEK